MALTHSPSIVTNGLVLCLDAGNRKSYPGTGTTWTDLSGAGNAATILNQGADNAGTIYSSTNGGYITFDGGDDRATSTLPALTSYTTSAWVRLRNFSSGERQLFQTANGIGLSVLSNLFMFYNGNVNSTIQTVVSNSWYNWVMTTTNTPSNSTKMFINNVADGNFANYGAITAGNITLAATNTIQRVLSCDIAIFSIYNRALTATEIAQNYNALKGRYGLS
jgi:hypothetical protein